MSSLNSCVRTRLVVVALCTTVLLATLPTATWAQRDLKPLSEEQIKKISEALPEKPTVKPAEPRKILIFWRCGGFFHGSIRVGNVALKMLGEKTGAYEAVVSDDPSMFSPEKLNRFDAVIFNNTTRVQLNETQRQALLDFVQGGKGIVGIHAATDNFYNWAEGAAMIGGLFAGHPWHEKVGVKIDDPDHPVVAAFGKKGFYITDEIYQFRDPYSRENLRVLMSLDMAKTSAKGRREDADFAVSWVQKVGQGRCFYCSLGHRDEIFWNPALLQYYLDGIQYALGDLKADAAPTATLSPAPKAAPAPAKKADAGPTEVRVYAAPKADGWITLFDGSNMDAWQKPAADKWEVKDGVLARKKGSGNIWTKEKFGDFILDLEFKATKGGKDPATGKKTPSTNSGVFLRSPEGEKNWLHGSIEIQVSSSYGPNRKPGKHDAGSVYDIQAPSVAAEKPVGEWNRMVITFKGNLLKIVMNGKTIIDINLDKWTEAHKNPDGSKNKFRTAYKDMAKVGHLGLQDHGQPVWYRNIKVKRLD